MQKGCKICYSRFKDIIEEKYIAGMSANAISKLMKEQYNFDVSVHTILTHMRKHYNLREAVRQEYIQQLSDDPEERMLKFVSEEIDEIVELDSIIREAKALRKLAYSKLTEAAHPREIEVWNSTWSSAAREAMRAMKVKMEKLGTSSKDDLVKVIKEMWDEDENVEE